MKPCGYVLFQRAEHDHHKKEIPIALSRWLIWSTAKNMSLLQDWFTVEVSST